MAEATFEQLAERIVGCTWDGAGEHAGHTVTAIDSWPYRADGRYLTCGRVRCSCGVEWNVGGWPTETMAELRSQS